MRILLVEDDPRTRDLLRQGLEEEGHAVAVASDGREGLEIARACAFDVIVLDVLLPNMTGVAVCRRLRDDGSRTPVLMLTARDQASSVVEGLDSGADDYLTKPFSFDVLLARIRAAGRRGPAPQPVRLRVGDLELDTGARQANRGGVGVQLTKTEYALLELLARHAGVVVPRERIFASVWSSGAAIESNTLDAFVRLLRNKIEPEGSSKLLHTVRGVGYRLGDARRA